MGGGLNGLTHWEQNWVIIGLGNGLAPFGAKPLPEPMLTHCQIEPGKQTSIKFESKLLIVIQKNECENVCKFVGHFDASLR